MPMDHTRRGLLRVVSLAGIGAVVLPGSMLPPTVQAAGPKLSPPPAPVTVNGWQLKASDR
ncbi:MAG: hypothetical protein ACTHVF_04705 [Halomonas sp.]|uniref:hypothetical protein n=1 Tax=unclassified Halomonas TaxID=2609666 RepID=UPI003FB98D8F